MGIINWWCGQTRGVMVVGLLVLAGCEASATREARNIAETGKGLARSEACHKAQDMLTKAKAAGPYELVTEESACKIVAKGLPEGADLPSGLSPHSSYGDGCSKLEAEWKTDYDAWEAPHKLTAALDCDKEGKPTQKLHDHAELEALLEVEDLLRHTLPHDPAEPKLGECIDTVLAFKKKVAGEKQKIRCEILKTEGAVPGMTFMVLLGRLHQSEGDVPGLDEKKLKEQVLKNGEGKSEAELKKLLTEAKLAAVKAQQATFCGKVPDLTPPEESSAYTSARELCTKPPTTAPNK